MNLRHAPRPFDARRRGLLFAPLLLLAAGAGPVSAARIAEQEFAERIRLADADLVLNGVGLRQVAWFKGYAAGLYLTAKAPTAPQALAVSGPKRIQMKMLHDVEPKEFVKAVDKGMRRNHSPAEHEVLLPRIAEFNRAILALGMIRKGDVVDLDFIPGTGLVFTRNGVKQGTPIPGEDLYAGIMKIFIGNDPVDKALKAGLLGGA
jgi:Chalcone isomerase-like